MVSVLIIAVIVNAVHVNVVVFDDIADISSSSSSRNRSSNAI